MSQWLSIGIVHDHTHPVPSPEVLVFFAVRAPWKSSLRRFTVTWVISASARGHPLPPLALVEPNDPRDLVLQRRLVAGRVPVKVNDLQVGKRLDPAKGDQLVGK